MAQFNLGRSTAPKRKKQSMRDRSSPSLQPSHSPQLKSRANKNARSNTPVLKSRGGMMKMDKSKSHNEIEALSDDEDGMPDLDLNKHTLHKSRSSANLGSSKDYRKKYEKKADENRELQQTLQEQELLITKLKRQLKKHTNREFADNEYDTVNTTAKHYERTIKHKDKEIANMRRRLKLAINDYEKVYAYYKKQLDQFKRNQKKWLDEQRSNGKDVTKYVFADGIVKIRVRKKGVRIYFDDGEDVVFEDIEVVKGKDYNDDDQYRTLVKKVKEEKSDSNGGKNKQPQQVASITVLDEDDMIILCLNELNARIRDFRQHSKDDNYAAKIQQRYDKLPIYHVDDEYLNKLKSNNAQWIRLFRKGGAVMPVVNGKRKGKLGAFFSAQREISQGKQPTICVQNNVILQNVNKPHPLSKPKHVTFGQHLQNKIDESTTKSAKMSADAKNDDDDDDVEGLPDISISNGWFTAQIEMQKYNQQPSVCIKNNIQLGNLQKAPSKFKLKKKVRAKTIQKRLDDGIAANNNKQKKGGHGKLIEPDKGDSSEEDENGNDIYRGGGGEMVLSAGSQRVTAFSQVMNGWFSAQMDIQESKQPAICVQNNVILENIEATKEVIDAHDPKQKRKKKNKKEKPRRRLFTSKWLQKRLNQNTKNDLPKSAADQSDDSEDEEADDVKHDDMEDKIHENAWYYKNEQRTKYIKALKISPEKAKLLKMLSVFLNRLLPTSPDFNLIKHYMPVFYNVYDVIAACFDGVLLAALVNFVADDLIDLRAMHLPQNKYPIIKEQVVENMYVIKFAIASLDLHEFPEFGIDFDALNDDKALFSWYNPVHTVDIMLLIMMHAYMGMMNRKVNIFKYPELFRLCLRSAERLIASKLSCKEWLSRWVIFMKKPKMTARTSIFGANAAKKGNHELFRSVDLAGYQQTAGSNNSMSWEQVKVEEKSGGDGDFQYVWDTDRDWSVDIGLVERKLSVKIYQMKTIAVQADITEHKNYLLQLMYLSDLFVFNNKIEKLSGSEHQTVMDILKKRPRDDESLIAWINSFKIQNEESGDFQYVDNLDIDISDGVILLRILDACKPGCVDWKGIRQTNDIRHKFDKLTNCNYLKQLCDSDFADIFHLVGLGANDIVDGNAKFIRSLLIQMQRYHSTKLMAKVLFKKKAITDDDLLTWMNNRLKLYKQMVAAMSKMHSNDIVMASMRDIKTKNNVNITSFSDKVALSDCLNFCNVVSSVNPRWIDYSHISDEQECKQTPYKKILNAKYLITIMRRLGCDNIFITPKEVVECEHRAILATSTAIMTIAARYNEYDQLALFAKNLKRVKAKMQKK